MGRWRQSAEQAVIYRALKHLDIDIEKLRKRDPGFVAAYARRA